MRPLWRDQSAEGLEPRTRTPWSVPIPEMPVTDHRLPTEDIDCPSLLPCAPTMPLLPWVGGKRLLARRIAATIADVPHRCYVEPCIGMGGVFLRRRSRPQAEVINDLNGDVVTLFRVAAEHPDELCRSVARLLHARAEFARWSRVPADTLTDVQRASRFILLQAASFGGKVVGRSFGYSLSEPARVAADRLIARLQQLHRRLQGVVIEQLDLFDCLTRYDRRDTLFYIDPPYWGTEGYYGTGWVQSDFQRLATALQGLRGRFILSINDRPEVRAMFGRWRIEAADVTWSAGGGQSQKRVGELIIQSG